MNNKIIQMLNLKRISNILKRHAGEPLKVGKAMIRGKLLKEVEHSSYKQKKT